MSVSFKDQIRNGIPSYVPVPPDEDPRISHAPRRVQVLSSKQKEQALKNALRYFASDLHPVLAKEFAQELNRDGRIYMRRYRPSYPMYARPISEYPAKTQSAAAIMHMIQNNLDPDVAQHPYELITYGGNGAVFQNWAQYLLTMKYLSEITCEQTLVLYSGHPLGVFPSQPESPRVVLTNGMVVPNYSLQEDYDRLAGLGVTSYGQMTAGSFMYIGPQGIVHGTSLTLLNAGRKYLGLSADKDLRGKVFMSSGLGGMSGAQAKAAVIVGAIGVIAEIDPRAVQKRYDQGWVMEVERDLDKLLIRVDKARRGKMPLSIAYEGNAVDMWERVAKARFQVDLGSDQTSLHAPFSGGYYPVGLSFTKARDMMTSNPREFKQYVYESLRRQVKAINQSTEQGMCFWDYGNAFLLESSRAHADIIQDNGSFRYPSYIEDIVGPLCFDYGFGPFRWVCTSGTQEDLRASDLIAIQVLTDMSKTAPTEIRSQIMDNLHWIEQAEKNQLVVGSKARILYSNVQGRLELARAFNRAIRDRRIHAPVVIGRDHHDVGSADSPYRETANIHDGSNQTADMAVHNCIGDAFRCATWVSMHNGGGVGWGEAINSGFGLVLDGSETCERAISQMIPWDVNNGLARRAWAGNKGALWSAKYAIKNDPKLCITLPHKADESLVKQALIS